MATAQYTETASSCQPTAPLTYDNDLWVCPRTGVEVPKALVPNLLYRKRVLQRLSKSPQSQRSFLAACRESPLLFINTFGWTYRPRYTCEDGQTRAAGVPYLRPNGEAARTPDADSPMITWPRQDDFAEGVRSLMRDGGIMLADKSREQGATVLSMMMLAWAWLFTPRFSALVISRKAAMVDSKAEDSLFGKVDYAVNHLPEWVIGPNDMDRVHGDAPLILNRRNGSRLVGETSNKDVGQSLRTHLCYIDEAARFPDGRALMKSIDSIAAGYLFTSTPNGPGTEFSRMRMHAAASKGAIKVFTLGYWDHPQIGLGRHKVCDHDGKITGKAGSWFWETPAFQAARARSTNYRDIRENWLIDHDTSGLLVLDSNAIARLRSTAVDPAARYEYENGELVRARDGRLLLWMDLDPRTKRPPTTDNYVIGGDFAQGVDQSQSVLAVLSKKTGRIVAELVDHRSQPHELAPVAMAMGEWFGGNHGYAFMIWERNGPGTSFGSELVKLGYPYLYYQRLLDRVTERKTRRWGWWSSESSREILFSRLNKGLGSGQFATPSVEGVADLAQWVYDEYGRMICGKLRDETTGAQARHGDRAIAYALAWLGSEEVSSYDPPSSVYPRGTLGDLAGHNEFQ